MHESTQKSYSYVWPSHRIPDIIFGTEVSTIGDEIPVEEELISLHITANRGEIPEAECSSQKANQIICPDLIS